MYLRHLFISHQVRNYCLNVWVRAYHVKKWLGLKEKEKVRIWIMPNHTCTKEHTRTQIRLDLSLHPLTLPIHLSIYLSASCSLLNIQLTLLDGMNLYNCIWLITVFIISLFSSRKWLQLGSKVLRNIWHLSKSIPFKR